MSKVTALPATAPELVLELLDPATLLVDLNIRQASLDKDFVASIADHGVIEPIVAVRTVEGEVRVRHGHRRTLAAIQAGLLTVPVVIVGAEREGDDGARIAKQWHENTHRAGLSNAEQVGVVDQLALLGLSAATIAKRLRAPKKHVEHALTVRGSELAGKATARYDFLTLEQAATLADYEEDHDTVTALVAAAKVGEVPFARAVAHAADARAAATATAGLRAALTDAGVRIVDAGTRASRLDRLTDTEDVLLTPTGHQQCPGHAAYLTEDWQRTTTDPATPTGQDDNDGDGDGDGEDDDAGWVLAPTAVYVCTDPESNGHRQRWGSRTGSGRGGGSGEPGADQKAADAAQRRMTLANNKAWRGAEPIRRDWLRGLAARKTAPKGSAAFITAALTRDSAILAKAMQRSIPYVCELLGVGCRDDVEVLAGSATDARAAHIALITVLAAYEDGTRVDTWRSPGPEDRRYFTWLAVNGYPLSDVEPLAAAQ
jgi:ParB family chromosome partitioning protein